MSSITGEAIADIDHTGNLVAGQYLGGIKTSGRKLEFFYERLKKNVSSLEVENVINAHPKVLESAVIGVPSELYDDEVKAYVVLKQNETLDPIEVAEWCKERLAYFKVPRYIEFRSEFPKTPTHRVQKYKLKQEKEDLTKDCLDLEKTDFKLR